MKTANCVSLGLFCVAAMIATTAAPSHAVLVGYWNFNEGSGQSVADRSNFGNTGTLGTNGTSESTDPTWTANGGGHTGSVGDYALNFLSANSTRVTVANSASLNIGGAGTSDGLTISAWVKINAPGGEGGDIISKGTTINDLNYGLNASGGTVYLRFSDNSDGTYHPTYGSSTTNITPNANAWHHVAVVLQESGSGTVTSTYVDGAPWGIPVFSNWTTSNNFAKNNATSVLIGMTTNQFGSGFFTGGIDDLAVWNEALPGSYISSLASGTAVPEPAMVSLMLVGGLFLGRRARRPA